MKKLKWKLLFFPPINLWSLPVKEEEEIRDNMKDLYITDQVHRESQRYRAIRIKRLNNIYYLRTGRSIIAEMEKE